MTAERGWLPELDEEPVEARWTEIHRSLHFPGLYRASLLYAYVYEDVVTWKDGLTLDEANRWCKRKMLGIETPEREAPHPLAASEAVRRWEEDAMRLGE